MNKQLAIELLGGTPKKAAAAMGYRSIQAVYLWPPVLPQATADRVRGVLSRTVVSPGPSRESNTEIAHD